MERNGEQPAPRMSLVHLSPGWARAPAGLAEHRGGAGVLVSGPSGCGKSTLARCLTGLIPHLYRGQLEARSASAGGTAHDRPLWQLAELAGWSFRTRPPQMLASTVEEEILFGLENLGLPRDEMARRLERGAGALRPADVRQRSPQTLSGGEQQKLALAAITARQPALLVLDEPLSMLDTTAALDFVAHRRELREPAGRRWWSASTARNTCAACRACRTLRLGKGRAALRPAPQVPDLAAAGDARCAAAAYRGLNVPLAGARVIRDLDLSLHGGQVVALVGRNGVGKTTLLRALGGLQPYTGVQVRRGAAKNAPQLGMVFQNPDLQLFNASVREEILYRLEEPDHGLYQWLMAVARPGALRRDARRCCSARAKNAAWRWQRCSCASRATACSWTSLPWGRTQAIRPS